MSGTRIGRSRAAYELGKEAGKWLGSMLIALTVLFLRVLGLGIVCLSASLYYLAKKGPSKRLSGPNERKRKIQKDAENDIV